MRFIDLRYLSGPNVFSVSPVTIARLELDDLTGKETTNFTGFAARLAALLPGLADHHCAAGRSGGFLEAMARGTYFGHVTEHVALELSGMAGREVHLGRTMWAGADGHYDVMTECPQDEPADSAVPGDLLRLAMEVVHDVLGDLTPRFAGELERIGQACERERLGVSTAALAAAARQRGIPVRRVGGLSLLRLGYGRHRKLACAALTSQTSAVGVDIAADKQLAKQLLAAVGIPVAAGVVAHSADEAAAALTELGCPVVVKPLSGSQGANIAVGVHTSAEAVAAYAKASATGDAVLVEVLVPGADYRVLVIDGQVAAAAQLRPATVTGDGSRTIGQLVAAANADSRRGQGHSRELTRITLDAEALSHLHSMGLDDHSVPADGQAVPLRRNANLSTGGTSKDVTDLVHPEVADMCRRAAGATGLDICGIDLRLADISAPLRDRSGLGPGQPCAVLEVNACPGLRMHLAPAEGQPRDVAAAVVDSMYPAGMASRIPVLSVTGTNGKTTTVRMVAQLLRQAGMRVGLACTDGVFVGGELVYAADASGPRSAEMVLDDPTVDAAVLETARGGITRRGLGYEQADVAVVTNITPDHLGDDGIDTFDELVHVKALVAEEIRDGGSVVLNADDPAVAALASRPAVLVHAPVIRYFSLTPGNEVIARHKAAGGACYEVIDGELTETKDGERRPVLPVADVPGAYSGRAAHVVANALAAVGAARAAGVSVTDIRRGLASFSPDADNPGRGTVFRAGSSPVIVDYGHNAAALHATGRFVREAWGGSPVAAVTLPGDRRDDLLVESAEAIAAWFGTVVLYEDSDKRGRPAGQMQELIGSALQSARPGIKCSVAENPADALRDALELAAGEPVLFLYEKLALARDALAAVDAAPWPEANRTAPSAAAAAETVAADAAAVGDAAAAVIAGAAEAVVANAAALVITDAADAALARARAAAPSGQELTTARPRRADGSADYGPATGLPRRSRTTDQLESPVPRQVRRDDPDD
ncbi:MAG TPA: cyanophycin synthetase [Streptosporangiaceae bacterium]|nr:cyanophycin synthetase [Streptosporangiaceae bacterium]